MVSDPQKQPEAPHWTIQLPWLVLFLSMVVAGVLKFDHSHVQRFHDRDVTQGAALIDLNTATQAELETLPGIGPVLAKRLISARPFADLEDFKRVPGIGPILRQRLLPKVMVQTSL